MFVIDGIKFTTLKQFSIATELGNYGNLVKAIKDNRISERSIALYLLGELELQGKKREKHLVYYNRKKVSPLTVIKELDINVTSLCELLGQGLRYEEIRLKKQLLEKSDNPLPTLKIKEEDSENYTIPSEQLRLGKHVLTNHEYSELLNLLKSIRKAETNLVEEINKQDSTSINVDPMV